MFDENDYESDEEFELRKSLIRQINNSVDYREEERTTPLSLLTIEELRREIRLNEFLANNHLD